MVSVIENVNASPLGKRTRCDKKEVENIIKRAEMIGDVAEKKARTFAELLQLSNAERASTTPIECAASNDHRSTSPTLSDASTAIQSDGAHPPIPVVRKRHGLSYDLEHVDPATRRRMESNRRSAAEARERQKAENRKMQDELEENRRACTALTIENERLRQLVDMLLCGGCPPTAVFTPLPSQRALPMLAPLLPSPFAATALIGGSAF
mmetsp:Transcript_74747/g.200318  ORF Transcript_74747/g.200318 Transcript_74747/m.200318 type:complete len:209 (-) Transcript_74747:300-926(-)